MPVTNKLTVYLIKSKIVKKEILKEVKNKVSVPGVGTFFYENSITKEPSWFVRFFNNSLGNIEIFMAAAKAVLLTSILHNGKKVYFVISWGAGWHLIREQTIEQAFGLKVTLNSVEKESIRSIEKSNIGANSKISKEQVSKKTNATGFGIDIEQDLLRAVTGASRFPELGKTISGADALSVSVRVDISNLPEFLSLCYERYLSKDYLDGFDWIDQIHRIKDPTLMAALNTILAKRFNAQDFDDFWMAVPDLVDWSDLQGFSYIPGSDEYLDDLYIKVFREAAGKIESLEELNHRTIHAISASTERSIDHWSVYECLYGEVTHKGRPYVLNAGKWYEVDSDFASKVNNYYDRIRISDLDLLEYDHDNEGDYNLAAASSQPEFLLMDKKTVMHGGGNNKIEFCDIYTKKKQMIHVKHAGASAVLSHLFQQGLNSAEFLTADVEFRKKLNKKLDVGWKIRNPDAAFDPGSYEVVFAVITPKKATKPEIPFFSKVSLKNTVRRLNSFKYKVAIKAIKSVK